eukprot:TRINITY_DN163_c1_g2_i7.p1 TRINITY_DN163_c1_g2~~TRINITY_DN163_c1_g2_i7.p1  ORF type:complete len:555 (+),score=115.13 TRINITY_DN163_c1_g2_i7:404-2068(+)
MNQLYGQTNGEKQLDENINKQEQQQNDDFDSELDPQNSHNTQEAQSYPMVDNYSSFEHESSYENGIVAGDDTYGSYSEEAYNEAYAHYSDWINQKWGEFVMQQSEWEQQQLSLDASYYESRFSEWGQSAYVEYYQLFPEQSRILFAGQPQHAQQDNGHLESEKVDTQDLQQQQQQQQQLDQKIVSDGGNDNYVASDQVEDNCLPPVDYISDAQMHQEATHVYETEDTQPSNTSVSESIAKDTFNSEPLADEKAQQQEQVEDMHPQIEPINTQQDIKGALIQPYPSLESWVDVPIKKLGKLGKLGGPTPWEQDLMTETEDEDDSLEEEQEPLSGDAARDSLSQPLYLQSRDVSPTSCATPRFDLVPHPHLSDDNSKEFMLMKSDISEDQIHQEQQRALRSTLQIIPPQPLSEELEQPITPIGQVGNQIGSGYSSVTTPESMHFQSTTLTAKNEEISSLQKRIIELEQILQSKQKEIDVIQRSQNDLLIALGQENGKVEKLREMLIDYGAPEEVIDEAVDEVEDEFGWGEEDDEEEEEVIEEQLETPQEAPQVDIC